jgi:ribulose 1,5-bisphosphate synthetase/thiazole synthase
MNTTKLNIFFKFLSFILNKKILMPAVLVCVGTIAVADDSLMASGDAVTSWNAVAMQVVPVDPGALLDSRAFAIMHAAVHDAVNGVKRRYQPYTANLSSPGASVAIDLADHQLDGSWRS